MNIVFFLFNVKTSGGAKIMIEIANSLSIKGHNVLIVVPKGSVSKRYPNLCKIKEVGFAFKNQVFSFLINLPIMIFCRLNMKPAVVINSFAITSYFSCIFAKLREAKPVLFAQSYEPLLFDSYHIQSKFILLLYVWLSKRSYGLSKLNIIYNSKWTYERIKGIRGNDDYLRIIPLGIDQNIFKPVACKSDKVPIRISCIYKPQKIKGWDTIRIAMNDLHRRGMQFKLVIMFPALIKNDGELGLSCDYEIICPASDIEIAKVYNSTDLFVNTSRYEGFCLPPLEAMACGTPVIATDSGGIREYAVDGENCILIAPDNVDALIEAVMRLIRDDDLRNMLVNQGLNTAKKRTVDSMNSSFEKYLVEIIGKGQ